MGPAHILNLSLGTLGFLLLFWLLLSMVCFSPRLSLVFKEAVDYVNFVVSNFTELSS